MSMVWSNMIICISIMKNMLVFDHVLTVRYTASSDPPGIEARRRPSAGSAQPDVVASSLEGSRCSTHSSAACRV